MPEENKTTKQQEEVSITYSLSSLLEDVNRSLSSMDSRLSSTDRVLQDTIYELKLTQRDMKSYNDLRGDLRGVKDDVSLLQKCYEGILNKGVERYSVGRTIREWAVIIFGLTGWLIALNSLRR